MTDECVICLKHQERGPLTGQLVGRAEGFRIYHAQPDDQGFSPFGWLFIESERHVPYLTDLNEDEATAVGGLRTRLARALRDELDAEYVLTFVLGLGVAHFHEHLVPRMPGVPKDVPWHSSDETLRKADVTEVRELAERVRARLSLSLG
jgi:ATP adenylyltransferase